MADKYHNEWIIREMSKEYRIFKSQSRAFHFLSDIAYDLDSSIEMLEGIECLSIMCLQVELLERKCFYLRMANGIGRLWGMTDNG